MRPATGVINPSRSPGRVLTLALAAAALGACVPTANRADLPDAATALPCTGQACVPNQLGAAVTTAPLVDCDAAQRGLEFFAPAAVLDNEYNGGSAQYFYQYVDGTAGIWPSGYQPPAIQQDVCGAGNDNDMSFPPLGQNHVLHESGGLFTGWGGGIGIGLEHLNQDSGLCTGVSPLPSYCPPGGSTQLASAVSFAALDVSQWDGISFWARRGPNGQPLMRVLVGDKFTDDDISYLMYVGNPSEPRLCERKGECSCLYQDTTCDWYGANDPAYGSAVTSLTSPLTFPDTLLPTAVQNGEYFCGPPASHPGAASSGGPGAGGNFCGRSLCNRPYSAYPNNGSDAEWVGRACTPFTYRNGTEADLCYNPTGTVDANGASVPADPLPAEADAQCGDHFTFPVHLSEEWQFFAIPFAQMSQQGWAKQAPYFDLTSASVVRFTWDSGYVDYYLDNVRFYRVTRPDGGVVNTPPP
jgi:hypothetical protein